MTETRQKRLREDRDGKRARLLAAARDLVGGKGAHALTIRAVAERAGYTPGAVYSYFESRDALALALAADGLGRLARELKTKDAGMPARYQALLAALAKDQAVLDLCAAALPGAAPVPDEDRRAFRGRLIALLEAAGGGEDPERTVGLAATVLGLALLDRAGELEALGLDGKAIMHRHFEHV